MQRWLIGLAVLALPASAHAQYETEIASVPFELGSRLQDAVMSPDGRLFFVEWPVLAPPKFTDGVTLDSLGVHGQRPWGVPVARVLGFVDDTLWVVDSRNARVAYFRAARAPEYIGTRSLLPNSARAFGYLDGGSFVAFAVPPMERPRFGRACVRQLGSAYHRARGEPHQAALSHPRPEPHVPPPVC